jgi:hypothetical protein
MESWNSLNPLIDPYARFDLYQQRCSELYSKPYVPFLGATLHAIHEMEKIGKDSESALDLEFESISMVANLSFFSVLVMISQAQQC